MVLNPIKININEEIVRKIKNRKTLIKVIFPVIFDKTIFLKKIKKYKPDVILGLGQHPRSKKIRLEKKAINLKKYSKENKREKVVHEFHIMPENLFATFLCMLF